MKSVKDFFKFINEKFVGQTFQIIPAFSSVKFPPFPFATYSIDDISKEIEHKEDGRIISDDGELVIEKMNFYEQDNILIKVYSYSKDEALLFRDILEQGFKFVWRNEINYKKYGMIEMSKKGEQAEKIDEQYLQCFMLNIIIDFNNIVVRETPILKQVDLVGDINKNIDMLEGENEFKTRNQ